MIMCYILQFKHENVLFELFIPGTIYYSIVAVVLNNKEIVSDWCVQEEEAIESAYNKLACQFGLTSPEGGCQ